MKRISFKLRYAPAGLLRVAAEQDRAVYVPVRNGKAGGGQPPAEDAVFSDDSVAVFVTPYHDGRIEVRLIVPGPRRPSHGAAT